jgi:hypothetical protein
MIKGVKATYALMQCFIDFTNSHNETIKRTERYDKKMLKKNKQNFLSVGRLINRNPPRSLYKAILPDVSLVKFPGCQRLYYDRSKPFEKQCHFIITI